ncbi:MULTISPECIES: acyltransferase [unclassified Polaromonas]|uniref:acyltransferase n=1 Tax=unclassified Polaromonas TaxID=2638319 RepID=UPI000F073AE3|nr:MULTISPECIES: acyltransferase [unclassified Polaromonas]AYQ27910.1 acyltransferase [Polaromonas sp. SP1]QGJ17229.1 acyltransferase [Polaromonas sp. Pch-P]
MAMLSRGAVELMGFASVGKDIQISDRASFYGVARIVLGDNVRIDDFCVLAAGVGGIELGRHVHIAVGSTLIGAGKITLSDFSGLSSRVSIYSSSDDYSGATMTNPTVPNEYTGVTHADVFLSKHVIVGSGCVILPGVTLESGVAVGALSLVSKNCKAFGIYAGNPARRISERRRDLLELELRFMASKAKQT